MDDGDGGKEESKEKKDVGEAAGEQKEGKEKALYV